MKKWFVRSLFTLVVAGIGFSPAFAQVELGTSISKALKNNPRIKVLQANKKALEFDLKAARAGYLPQVDAVVGYGLEQHSDATTRAGGDPGNEEWEGRGEASITLTQLIVDGGAQGGTVDAQKALVKSASYRVEDNAESVALDAVVAHLEVFRQTRLVALAQKTVKSHEGILASLQERSRAGAGNRADVAQAQGRLARAKSSLLESEAALVAARANYERVVGEPAGDLALASVPAALPGSLELAVEGVRRNNPKIQALSADVQSAEAEETVAVSSFFPRLNLELSSAYDEQVEGDASWQWTNSAMVRARWNLFNGGRDLATRRSAHSRTQQALSDRNDQVLDVVELTKATWAQYEAAKARVQTFGEAVSYNEQTLDAYLKQFNVAQRSLLDVLDAENELFQTSGLLVTARVNQAIAGFRLLALQGNLRQEAAR